MITCVTKNNNKRPGRQFARHGLVLRFIGNLGSFIIFLFWLKHNVLFYGYWILVVSSCLFWPVTAYAHTFFTKNSYLGEWRNIHIDAVLCGTFAAILGFPLAPTCFLFMITAMVFISIAGLAGLLRSLMLFFAAAVAVHVSRGGEIQLATSLDVLAVTLGCIIAFSFYHSFVAYNVMQRRKKQSALLEEISRLDGLSGLHNRGYWESAVQREFDECALSSKSSVILLIDIDHFKQINDGKGHVVGDTVIGVLGRMIKQSIRPQDIAGRYGGDEFGIILCDIDVERASEIAERLRENIYKNSCDENGVGIHFTVSVGVQGFSNAFKAYSSWVAAADDSLYAAKDSGRNRVFVGCL